MNPFPRTLHLVTATATLLLGTGVLHAGAGGIHDNGAFFSEQAQAEASRVIADVARVTKKNIVVETFREIPESARNSVELSEKGAANQFFRQWAETQARQQSVNGIYILLVRQPAHLQVVVGNETLKQAFTTGNRETLVGTMLAKLRAKQNDAALIEGVNFVASMLRAHSSDTSPAVAESSWAWVLPVLIGVAVLWVVFGLLRSLFGGRANPTGTPQGAGGGGFGRSLLGGLFGAAAGMWMYDQFFGSHGNAAPGSDPNDTAGSGDSGTSGQDTDYTSSGGGFGDDSGGGFGGGDSDGGDF